MVTLTTATSGATGESSAASTGASSVISASVAVKTSSAAKVRLPCVIIFQSLTVLVDCEYQVSRCRLVFLDSFPLIGVFVSGYGLRQIYESLFLSDNFKSFTNVY